MTKEVSRRHRRRLWIALAAVALVLAAVIVPPMISISRYKARIVQLVSQSIGRPVHLSGVELRLLPWPSFVLSNFVVDEDPAYGAEPVLHADSVTTDVRLLALWRGRFEIGSIKVENASLNLVRMPGGRWNLDPIFRSAAAKAGAAINGDKGHTLRLPYLEATQSRINFKNGPEKLPFSIINADVSLWEESPGDWRIRLRGQPARTDVNLFQEDTGVVRLDASVRHAPALRDMPIRVDLDWREAQLGQLSRLLTGSDPGWRGNLTANLHLDGTPETTHVTARLRATGVHRAEFAPAEALDFDANCAFIYHYSSRALQNLACESPLGAGHLRLAGDLPGSGAQPRLTLALDRIPVNAGLAFLRTIREDVDPSLSASGSISGKMTFSGKNSPSPAPAHRRRTRRKATAPANPTQPLTGSFALSSFRLSGGSLSNPIHAARVVFQPAESSPGDKLALTATADVPFGAPVPLTFTPRLTAHGYQVGIHGEASLADAKQLAHLAGISQASALDALTGGPVSLNLSVQGPWLPPEPAELAPPQVIGPEQLTASADPAADPPAPSSDNLAGTVALRDAHWRPDFLARSVIISQATLHFTNGQARWDPIVFSYGPLKATATVTLPTVCVADHPCPTRFEIQFGKLKAAELQSAILGAREQVSLFDSLVDRLHLSSAPNWPPLNGTIKAAALELGPVELLAPSAELEIKAGGAKIASLDARLLGGLVHASGTFTKPDTDQGRPAYSLRATFSNLSAPTVGKLLGMRLSGNPIDGGGKIDISGVTAHELASTAVGTLHFDWRHGAIAGFTESPHPERVGARTKPQAILPQLARFSRFTGEATIDHGAITILNAEVDRGGTSHPVAAEFRFGNPVNVTFTEPKDALASTSGSARQAK